MSGWGDKVPEWLKRGMFWTLMALATAAAVMIVITQGHPGSLLGSQPDPSVADALGDVPGVTRHYRATGHGRFPADFTIPTSVELLIEGTALTYRGPCGQEIYSVTVANSTTLHTTRVSSTQVSCANDQQQNDEWLRSRFGGSARVSVSGDTLTFTWPYEDANGQSESAEFAAVP